MSYAWKRLINVTVLGFFNVVTAKKIKCLKRQTLFHQNFPLGKHKCIQWNKPAEWEDITLLSREKSGITLLPCTYHFCIAVFLAFEHTTREMVSTILITNISQMWESSTGPLWHRIFLAPKPLTGSDSTCTPPLFIFLILIYSNI